MTTTNQTDAQMKLADVTQADREAAALALGYKSWDDATDYRTTGAQDRHRDNMVKHFAAHRLATEARAQGLVEALEDSKRAVQAFLDMVNVMQRVQALPIPVFLETAQHNCPIILQNLDQALATWRRT